MVYQELKVPEIPLQRSHHLGQKLLGDCPNRSLEVPGYLKRCDELVGPFW